MFSAELKVFKKQFFTNLHYVFLKKIGMQSCKGGAAWMNCFSHLDRLSC